MRTLKSAIISLLISVIAAQVARAEDGTYLSEVSRQNITSDFQALLKPEADCKNFSIVQLRAYYAAIFERLSGFYENGVIDAAPAKFLQPYSGRIKFKWLGTHMLPLALISPEVFDPKYVQLFRLQTRYLGKEIPGLLLETKLHPYYRSLYPQDFLELQYGQSINARIAGFRSAQLILPLSKNVEVAPTYYYNGFLPWSTHPLGDGTLQVKQPIELTTYAHPAGDDYVLSPTPDFSLRFLRYDREPVQLTFFLWKHNASRTRPDFVFQILFREK